MCGITGAAAIDGKRVPSREILHRMCEAIHHRGPDAEGIHYSPEAMLGMRRLAIIDPAGGEQPIYNESRDICAVVNGEIYNYRDLRRQLQALGHEFRSGSDVECVVHAYEEFGTECFAKLRGMFAIAIWDGRSRSLVLARDRFGKKPLFYTQSRDALLFASELKCLLQVPGLELDIDRRVVDDYMVFGYVPTPDSIYAGVRKLKPAHYLVFHDGHTRIREYWNLEYAPKLEYGERTLTDMLESRLDSAVAARLNSDVPFGAFLSGGVDSSLVVALMAKHLDAPVKTFSIGFEDSAFDESADARRVAERLGTEHHELVVRPDAVEMLESIAWYLDEPMADSSVIPTFLVSRLAAEHVKMVLTGDGGDEIFGGYDRYLRHLQLVRLKGAGMAHARPMLDIASRHLPSALGARIGRVAERLRMQHPHDYLSTVILDSPSRIRHLLAADGATQASRGTTRSDELLGPLDAIISRDIRSYMLDDILVKVDRASMANSLEARAPLLDHPLAEFAARLPERFKIRGRVTKYLLKRVAERHFPATWVHKKKQGFSVPLARWLRTDLAELLMDTIDSRDFANRDVFKPSAARALATEHIRGERDNSATLWAILVFESWAQRYSREPRWPSHVPERELRPATG